MWCVAVDIEISDGSCGEPESSLKGTVHAAIDIILNYSKYLVAEIWQCFVYWVLFSTGR